MYSMAQQDMDWLEEELQRLEQKIKEQQAKIEAAMKADEKSELIASIGKERERLVDEQKVLLAALQARLASPSGANFTEEDVLGLRSLYRPKETLSISGISEEQWETIKATAMLEYRPWLGAINPASRHQPQPFGRHDSSESSQSKYLSFLQQELKPVLNRWVLSWIEVVDARQHPNCLAIRGLESVFGYNFNGETDILLAHRQAVRGNQPETGSVAAFVLKTGQFTRRNNAQACVTLITLNLKSSSLRPWVLLTDLNNRFTFFWMDGPTIFYYSAENASEGWSIILDLLQRDASVTFAEPEQQEATNVPILARKAIPAELGTPRGVISDVGNLNDVMDEEEARAYHLLYKLSVQPALAPFLPLQEAHS
ncbi:hypothetical protein COCOBI_11-5680 [Coccomyxa sp. Obi]|nr:hypothetical protein COCOBI_11-5680 [Coccomyxa sp. Obi]